MDKGAADWRGSVSASPSLTSITYNTGTAAKGSKVALTVTPNVSVYRYHFGHAISYEAVDLLMQEVENSNVTWSSSSFVYVNSRTAEVTLSNGSSQACYFYVKFSAPTAGHGTFTSHGATAGAARINGDNVGGYLTFAPGTPVTVAVALSMTSMSRAQQNFTREFSTFDFSRAVRSLRNAWNAKLGKIDVQGASTLTAKEIYTGLYTLYANIIDVTDNPSGYKPVAPSTRLLTIGSSIWWERVGGGYFRCSFDQGRNVYAFLTLLDPAVMRDVLNTYLSQYNRDGFLMGNWDPFAPGAWSGQQWGFFSYFFLAARLEGVTGVDYRAAETAILKTMGMHATNMYLVKEGYYKYGYIPANIGTENYLSRGLEFSTQLLGLAHLGYVLGDKATYRAYYPWGTAYLKTWNPAGRIFQARNTNGSWAPAGAGLFEGSTASYAFDEPQDGLGLRRHLRRRRHELEDRRQLRRAGHLLQRLSADAALPRHFGGQPVGVAERDPELLPSRVQLAQHVGGSARQRLALLHRQRKRRGPRQSRHLPDPVAGYAVDPQQPGGDQSRDPRADRYGHRGTGQFTVHAVRLVHQGQRLRVSQPLHLG